ncbi:helix-turn-helix domain-containing protein [Streptomyces sp. NBC_01764]|uniref:helix-turn-helix domain-containing protein n=1 Tax=Streptomyces sp. NBC_01764 TaxID=2975935 RepID=UPI00338DEBA2
MARPPKEVCTDNPYLHEFASELRALKSKAGDPPYRVMASKSGVSITSLSQAASGRVLPTWRTTAAFVRAARVSEAKWRAKWESLNREMRAPVAREHDDDGSTLPLNPAQRRIASWPAVWERWTRTELITPSHRAESELDLILAMRSLKEFRSLSLRDIAGIALYSHSAFGAALNGQRTVTPRLLVAFLKGCNVHTFGEHQAWLDLLSRAVPEQREKAEREMRTQHRTFR